MAGIARGAELVFFSADRAYQAGQAQICERVGFDVFADFRDGVAGCDQFFLRGRIDSVKAGRQRRRATDPHVDFFRARGPDHLDDFAAGRSTDDGIIDEDHALPGQQLSNRIQFHLHTKVPNRRFRLDECAADVVVTNQSEGEWNAGLLRISNRRGYPGVGNRHDEIGIDRTFLGENPSHQVTAGLNRASEHDAVRTREINVLENTFGKPRCVQRLDGPQFLTADVNDFARLHLAKVSCADEIERAGLRSKHVGAVHFPDRQRTEAVRIAHPDQRIFGQQQKRKGPLNLCQRLGQRIQEVMGLRSRQKVKNDFTVAGGLEDGSLPFEFLTQADGIDQVPVVNERNCSVGAFHNDRLRITFAALAGRGITRMTDGVRALELRENILVIDVGDIAHRLVRVHLIAVRRRHTSAFLAAVLQSIKAEICHSGRVGMIRDPKDSTH